MSLRQHIDLLVTYLRPQQARVFLLGGLLLAGIVLDLFNPQIIRFFLDTAQSGGPQAALLAAAALYIAVSLVQRGVAVLSSYVSKTVGWKATNALRSDLALHCLGLDMPFHKQHTPGELIERIDGDVTALANFFSAFVARVVGNGLLVIGILLVLARENLYVGGGLALYTAVTLLALKAIQPLAVSRWTAERATSAELYGFIEERISGAEEIRAAGAEAYTMRRLYGLLRRAMEAFRASIMVDTLVFNVTSLLSIIGYAVGLALGVVLYTRGQATIGTAYMIVAYVGMLAEPLQRIRAELQDLQHATASIGRVNELLQIHPSTTALQAVRNSPPSGQSASADFRLYQTPVSTGGATLPTGALSVAFRDISFAYDDEGRRTANKEDIDPFLAPSRPSPAWGWRGGAFALKPVTEDERDAAPLQGAPVVLRDVTFRLEPGRVLGVLGRTGSGKTTMARLLLRLYDADVGAVEVGDRDIRGVPIGELRSRVALVTQDVQLFQASLRDNLTFFDSRIGDAEVERALRELRLWDWAAALPQGLDTSLLAGGGGISAGEAQLVAFARAFLKDPGLVILDEASSRLDPATEALLESAIDRLFRGRTGIVIAHRLRTVHRADELLILEAGRVAEYGSRERLAADPGSRFSSLLRTGLEEALA